MPKQTNRVWTIVYHSLVSFLGVWQEPSDHFVSIAFAGKEVAKFKVGGDNCRFVHASFPLPQKRFHVQLEFKNVAKFRSVIQQKCKTYPNSSGRFQNGHTECQIGATSHQRLHLTNQIFTEPGVMVTVHFDDTHSDVGLEIF
jgi:hypothetical protein